MYMGSTNEMQGLPVTATTTRTKGGVLMLGCVCGGGRENARENWRKMLMNGYRPNALYKNMKFSKMIYKYY